VVILVLVLLELLGELLLAELLQCISLRLQLLLKDFHFLVLLFLQLNDLQANLVLTQFLSFYLLLSFQFLDEQFRIVGLVINFLVSTFLFNSPQVNDVLGDADSNSDSFLKVLFHFNELSIMMNSLQLNLFILELSLLLNPLVPLNRKVFNLRSVLLIDLL